MTAAASAGMERNVVLRRKNTVGRLLVEGAANELPVIPVADVQAVRAADG